MKIFAEVGIAATKIQASFRGHKARREAEKKAKDGEGELTEELQKLKTTEEVSKQKQDNWLVHIYIQITFFKKHDLTDFFLFMYTA